MCHRCFGCSGTHRAPHNSTAVLLVCSQKAHCSHIFQWCFPLRGVGRCKILLLHGPAGKLWEQGTMCTRRSCSTEERWEGENSHYRCILLKGQTNASVLFVIFQKKTNENSRKTLIKKNQFMFWRTWKLFPKQSKIKCLLGVIFFLRANYFFPTLGWTIIGYQLCAIKPDTIKWKLQEQ